MFFRRETCCRKYRQAFALNEFVQTLKTVDFALCFPGGQKHVDRSLGFGALLRCRQRCNHQREHRAGGHELHDQHGEKNSKSSIVGQLTAERLTPDGGRGRRRAMRIRPESREARDGRVFLSFLFEGKRVFGINAGHELLLAVQAGQAVNETEPVVEYGLSGVIPRVLQRCAQLFFERVLERFSG